MSRSPETSTSRDSWLEPLQGVEVAYYLVHSLDDADFERKDAEAARAFASAAAEQGVQPDHLHGWPR